MLLVNVGWSGRSKNGRRLVATSNSFYFDFGPYQILHTKFQPNRMRNTEVKKFSFLVGLVGPKMIVGVGNSMLFLQKLTIFAIIGWFWLVGLVGQNMPVGI